VEMILSFCVYTLGFLKILAPSKSSKSVAYSKPVLFYPHKNCPHSEKGFAEGSEQSAIKGERENANSLETTATALIALLFRSESFSAPFFLSCV
jgi:hypothetical protein